MSTEQSQTAQTLPIGFETFFDAYVECALWSSTYDDGEREDRPFDDNFGPEDIDPDSLAQMKAECIDFLNAWFVEPTTEDGEDGITINNVVSHDWKRAGHDFWLNRNGHGAGFWDGDWDDHPEYGDVGDKLSDLSEQWGTSDLYVGDDGRVYVS